MASVPATSDAHAATAALFTSGLTQRAAPVMRTPRRALRTGGPGRLAGRIENFGMRLGLSHTSRWALDAQGGSGAGTSATAPVRPPLNYWPWGDADQSALEPEPVVHVPTAPVSSPRRPQKPAASQGNRRLEDLRRMLGLDKPDPQSGAGPTAGASAAGASSAGSSSAGPRSARRRAASKRDHVVHRGLPQTLARRSGTSRGAPGDIAQRMRPEAVDLRAIGTRAATVSRVQPKRAERTTATPEPLNPRTPTRSADVSPRTATGSAEPAVRRAAEPVVRRSPAVPSANPATSARATDVQRHETHAHPVSARPSAANDSTSTNGSTSRNGPPSPSHLASPNGSSSTRVSVERAPTSQRRDDTIGSAVTREDSPTTAGPSPSAGVRRGEFSTDADARIGRAATSIAIATRPPQGLTPGSVPVMSRAFPRSVTSVRDDPAPEETAAATLTPAATQIADNASDRFRVTADGRTLDTPSARLADADRRESSVETSGQSARIVPSTRPPAPLSDRTSAAPSPSSPLTSTSVSPAASRDEMARDLAVDEARSLVGRVAPESVRRGIQPDAPGEALVSDFTSAAVQQQTSDNLRTSTARRPETPTVRPPVSAGATTTTTSTTTTTTAEVDRDRSEAGRRAGPMFPATSVRSAATRSEQVVGRIETGATPSAVDPAAIAAGQPKIRRPGDIAGVIGADMPGSVDDLPVGPVPHRTPVAPPSADTMHRSEPAPAGLTEQRGPATRPTSPPIGNITDWPADWAPAIPPSMSTPTMSTPASTPTPSATPMPTTSTAMNSAATNSAASTSVMSPSTMSAQTTPPSTMSPSTTSPATVRSTAHSVDHSAHGSPATEVRARHGAEVRSRPAADPTVAPPSDRVFGRRTERRLDQSRDLDNGHLPTAPPLAAVATLRAETNVPSKNHQSGHSGVAVPSASPRTAAELATPGNDAAARFRATLQRAPATTSALPSRWRPLATAIVGERSVRISTGPASRAALQAAGAIAATTGNVVHLARPLRGEGDAHLLAHELTHVANPSPEPRFFDDRRDSPEERRAELVADVIRRSPMLPGPSAGPPTPGAATGRAPRPAPTLASLATGGRSERGTATAHPGNDPTTVSASDLAAQITGAKESRTERAANRSGSGTDSRPSHRECSPSAPPSTQSSRPTFNGTRSRSESVPDVDGSSSVAARPTVSDVHGTWPMLSSELDSSSLTNFVDWIMEQLEDRIGRELERRGGRYRGEF